MPDMYDKLGDLLNEALDSGYIPQENKEKKEDWKQEDLDSRKSKSFDSGLFSFNFFENQVKNEKNKVEIDNNNQKNQPKSEKIKVKILKKEQISNAQVIKMHNYTNSMQFPPYIQKALTTLDIAYPINKELIKQKYRFLLKKNHPDTKTTIQTSDNVNFSRHLSIDQIKEAYKTLCSYVEIE